MADLATLQTRLSEAEAALHKLSIGALRASVSYDGQTVTFTKAEMGELRAYIADLRSQIAALTATPAGRRRPLHLGF